MTLWEKFKRYDNYRKAVILTLPITLTLLVSLIATGADELFLSEWFIGVIAIPNFVAFQLGTAAYFGGLFDSYKRKNRQNEVRGTLVGIVAGLLVGLWLLSVNFAVPFAASLLMGASLLYLVRQINVFSGLGNRIGRMFDLKSRPMIEKKIVATSILMAFTLGVTLVATASAAFIGIAGITTFVAAGGAVPIWLASALFIFTLTSNIGSTADYVAKSVSFLRAYYFNPNPTDKEIIEENQFIKGRFHEYRSSLIGVGLGLLAGTITIAALTVAQPALLTGALGIVMGLLILTTSASVFGSTCSRIGRLWDEFRAPAQANTVAAATTPILQQQLVDPHPESPRTPRPSPTPCNDDAWIKRKVSEPVVSHTQSTSVLFAAQNNWPAGGADAGAPQHASTRGAKATGPAAIVWIDPHPTFPR